MGLKGKTLHSGMTKHQTCFKPLFAVTFLDPFSTTCSSLPLQGDNVVVYSIDWMLPEQPIAGNRVGGGDRPCT